MLNPISHRSRGVSALGGDRACCEQESGNGLHTGFLENEYGR